MKEETALHFKNAIRHLYISPLEWCNLHCRMCYTKKTRIRITNTDILAFIDRYTASTPLDTVTFCGGEVFLMDDFPQLVNAVTERGVIVQIITNGTVNRLDTLNNPNAVNLIVSIDGLPPYHDKNRGAGMWDKSTDFLKDALSRGFHTEIFSIVTGENLPDIPVFETMIAKKLGTAVPITYHPRKPMAYLTKHPVSNTIGVTDGFSFITPENRRQLGVTHSIFPPLQLGCYQISVMSDGNVYGCCEGIRPLGVISDDIPVLLAGLKNRLDEWEAKKPNGCSHGCVEPDFVCGLE